MIMQTQLKKVKGGAFLIEEIGFEDVFTPEDVNEEQKMMGKATEDFVK
jgi:hypothetical protein